MQRRHPAPGALRKEIRLRSATQFTRMVKAKDGGDSLEFVKFKTDPLWLTPLVLDT